jgi:hypothetical protein
MWGAGFAAGIGVGFTLGLIVGRLGVRQKPWSELAEKEKRTRMILIGVGSFFLLLGIFALVWVLLSK